MRGGWTGRLWAEAAGTYAAILKHPFLAGLTDGSLDPELFTHYVGQDAHYLRDFARTLIVVGSKAPTHAAVGMFARHAASTAEVELALHDSLLTELGIQNIDVTPVAPTTLAYTSYLLATAHRGTFADGFAAVLPCYWIYAEVGAELVKRGSPDPRYQRWIDTYADDEYQTSSPRCWRWPTTLARPYAPPTRRAPGPISPPPPAMSGCSGTPRGAARCGRSDDADTG